MPKSRPSRGHKREYDDREAAGAALDAFVNTPSWDETRRVLEAQRAVLLSDTSLDLLRASIAQYRPDGDIFAETLEQHLRLLQRARRVGTDAAFLALHQELIEERATIANDLLAWVNTPDWISSHAYLTAHPELLSEASGHVLDQLLAQMQAADDSGAIATLSQHRELLATARREGVRAAYGHLSDPGSATARDSLAPDNEHLLSQLATLSGPEDITARTALLEHAVALIQRTQHPILWAAYQRELGNALQENPQGDRREQLVRAIACFEAALQEFRRDVAPLDWAATLYNKGNALGALARLDERPATFREAIACYDYALQERRQDVDPPAWAKTQYNKGNTLADLAGLLSGDERLASLWEAVICYDAALQERRREAAPNKWAQTQHNKGTVLIDIAGLVSGDERRATLQAAITCFGGALEVYRREVAPAEWAAIQFVWGTALHHLANQTYGEEQVAMLREAITCFSAALQERPHDIDPLTWHNKRGIALRELASLLSGEERIVTLRQAIDCFNAALEEHSRAANPLEWAGNRNNMGNALHVLSILLSGEERQATLQEAITCYYDALTVYSPTLLPFEHLGVAQEAGLLCFDAGSWAQAAHYLSMALQALDNLFRLAVTARIQENELAMRKQLAADLAYALVRNGGTEAAVQAVQALERGRARATGDVVVRYLAQLDTLAPDLLARFRRTRDWLADAVPNMQRDRYEEALKARAEYDHVVDQIRTDHPDFLQPDEGLGTAVHALMPGERLAYVACTRAGAAAILLVLQPHLCDRVGESAWICAGGFPYGCANKDETTGAISLGG